MDTCLSLTSCKAGSGLQGPTHIALSSISNRCETALINTHSEVTLPQMSKRIICETLSHFYCYIISNIFNIKFYNFNSKGEK